MNKPNPTAGITNNAAILSKTIDNANAIKIIAPAIPITCRLSRERVSTGFVIIFILYNL